MSKPLSHLRAIAYAFMAYSLWVLADSLTKLAGQAHVPFWQIIEFMSLSSAITIIIITAYRKQLRNLVPKRYGLETLRSCITLLLAVTYVVVFTHLPLTNVYVVIFFAPMLIALFAAQLMHEHVSRRLALAIMAGFIGVVIAINPMTLDLHGGALVGYIALPVCLILYVVQMLMMRFISRTEHSESMACFPQLFRVVVLLPFCLWKFTPLTMIEWAWLIGLGVLSAVGWLLISAAIKHAPAAVVTPLQYTQIVSGAIMGYLIWDDVPTWHMVVGAAIIVASGIYMAQHTHHRSRRLADQALPT